MVGFWGSFGRSFVRWFVIAFALVLLFLPTAFVLGWFVRATGIDSTLIAVLFAIYLLVDARRRKTERAS